MVVTDNILYNLLDEDDFIEDIVKAAYNDKGIELEKEQLCVEMAGSECETDKMTAVYDGLYLNVIRLVTESVSTIKEVQYVKAQLTEVPNHGSMLSHSYVLDSTDIERMPGKRYNIGIGIEPEMNDGIHRYNYIAINDDEGDPQFVHNRYVSRAHAYITYNPQYGFLLNAEMGGIRINGKRTHIFRDAEMIELDNVNIPEVLHDGDYIVLSKNVHLLFKLTNDD